MDIAQFIQFNRFVLDGFLWIFNEILVLWQRIRSFYSIAAFLIVFPTNEYSSIYPNCNTIKIETEPELLNLEQNE